MTVLQALIHPKLILALAAYALFSTAMLLLAGRLEGAVRDVPVSHWIFDNLGIPLVRAFALTLFIILAHPVLFGIADAPTVAQLFDSGRGQLSGLVNLAFMVGIVLPFIPVIGQLQFLALPIQGMAISGLLFQWLQASEVPQNLSPWPGWDTMIEVAALAWLTHTIAHRLTDPLGKVLDQTTNKQGFQSVTYQALILLFQAPVILVYTLNLGRQWPV